MGRRVGLLYTQPLRPFRPDAEARLKRWYDGMVWLHTQRHECEEKWDNACVTFGYEWGSCISRTLLL